MTVSAPLASAAGLLLLLLLQSSHASIEVLDTRKSYPSRQRDDIGQELLRGRNYAAHIQYLPQNPSLCPTNYHVNVTVPDDGQPVALVASHGDCSLEEKAEFVMNQVHPAGVVKFLILGSGTHADSAVGDETGLVEDTESETRNHGLRTQINFAKIIQRDIDNDDVPLYFVHVSSGTESEFVLDVIRTQPATERAAGGPLVRIDSRIGTMDADSALWVAISAMISACMCSFMLLCNGSRNGWWEPPEEPPQPQRPTRPRLTREQVKRLLPRYRYDSATNSLQHLTENTANLSEPLLPPPVPLELEDCAICLDDYQGGERLRCLPCNHAFHSKCIGKWLYERSATCPLCKTDILDEDEEQEEEDEESAGDAENPSEQAPQETPQALSGWWERLNRRGRDAPTTTELQEGEEVAGGDTIEVTTTRTEEPARTSWWSRIFSSRRQEAEDDDEVDSLDEPLLRYDPESPQQVEEQLQDQGNVESTPDSPEQGETTAEEEA